MYKTASLVLLASASALATWPVPQAVPRTSISLTEPAQTRYYNIISEILELHGWENSYANVAAYWDTLPTAAQVYMEKISLNTDKYFPAEYAEEINGIAAAVAALGYEQEFPLREIVALNLMYEWTSFCTSIVAEDSHGVMWHARNMDWNFGGFSIYNITYIVDFKQNGVTQYTGIQWIGYVGILSGTKPGFTVTVDQREHAESDPLTGNMDAMDNGAQSIGMLLRSVFARNGTFTDAVDALASTYIASPVYYNVGGKNKDEGAIITRNRFGNTTDIWKWNSGPQPCCPDIQSWYLIQTNYDHWTTKGDDRQSTGIAALNAVGQSNVNPDTLFSVLETAPVLNSGTQYSMVVQNGGSYLKVLAWQ